MMAEYGHSLAVPRGWHSCVLIGIWGGNDDCVGHTLDFADKPLLSSLSLSLAVHIIVNGVFRLLCIY